MASPIRPAPSPPSRSESDLVLPEGLQAGLVGGLAVVAVYLVPDLLAGNWLRTPTMLGSYLLHGSGQQEAPMADAGLAGLFSFVHFAAWAVAGFAASGLLYWAERRPERRWLPLYVLCAWIAGMVALDLILVISPLPTPHLWIGSIVGGAAMAAYLLWRHPALQKSQGAGTS